MRNNAAYLPENPIVYIIFPESIHNRASFCYLCLAVISVWNMPVRMSQPEAGANILQATGGWRYRCTAMMSGNEDCLLIIDYPYVGAIMWRKV